MYTYIDESGDTGYTRKSTRYFVLAAIIVPDPVVLRRVAKEIHNFKLHKKKVSTLHANKESGVVKNKIVRKVVNLDIRCAALVMDKVIIKDGDLYGYGLKIFGHYFEKAEINTLCVAKRDTRPSYNQKIIHMLSERGIKSIFSDPDTEKALQIADFYSWVIFSYLEHNLPEYFLKLCHQIQIIYPKQSPRGTCDLPYDSSPSGV